MIDRAFARVPVVRAKLAILVTLLITAWLTYRLSDVQIRQSSTLSRLALSQHSETVDAFAKRGPIVDRDGTVLVRSLPSESVYAVPTSIDAANVPDIAAKLSPILGYPPDRLDAALRERTPFRYLKRKIPHSVAERVQALGIDGIGLKPEDTGVRYAPSGRLASTVLGFVGTEEDGLAGLEYSFDGYLRGMPGKTRIEADEFGRAIPFGDSEVVERAVPGKTLVLTLDSYVQFEAEHLIEAAMKTWHAQQRDGDGDGRAHGRDLGDGQRAGLRSQPLRRIERKCVARPRGRRRLRAGLDVQADHRGGRARERQGDDEVALPGARSARRRRPYDPQRRGRLHGRLGEHRVARRHRRVLAQRRRRRSRHARSARRRCTR